MLEITPETAADYLRDVGLVPSGAAVDVQALGWGVSNIVLKVDVAGQPPFVLKQSRERLRTAALWVSRLDRIWAEVEALRWLAPVLTPRTIPAVLFEDRENYLFAMSCAPDDSAVWKERLLAGEVDERVAGLAGEALGAMHAAGAPVGLLTDTTVFDQLRIDPFYRTTLRAHPDLVTPLSRLINEAAAPPETTFVHADFSPKNILVHARGLTVVDFETAHAGDPAFDLGFFASHLILKAIRGLPTLALLQRFWEVYRTRAGVDPRGDRARRAAQHAAACTLARVDGKSPVDYLDERGKSRAVAWARAILLKETDDVQTLLENLAREMHERILNPGT